MSRHGSAQRMLRFSLGQLPWVSAHQRAAGPRRLLTMETTFPPQSHLTSAPLRLRLESSFSGLANYCKTLR